MLLSISASDLNTGKKVWISAGTTQNVLFHLLYPTGFPRNFLYMVDMQPMHPRNLVPTKSSVRTSACSCYRMWNASHPCYDLLTAVTIGYLLTSVTWLYRGLRWKIHWGDVFYSIFPLPSYGIQLIAGLENFTSERHFFKVPTRATLLALLI